jgi:hypothetical protein
MERYQQILQRLAKQSYNQDQNMPLFLALCEQKDPAILPKISYGSWCPYSSDLTAALPVLDQWKDDEYLLYAALLNAGGHRWNRRRQAECRDHRRLAPTFAGPRPEGRGIGLPHRRSLAGGRP